MLTAFHQFPLGVFWASLFLVLLLIATPTSGIWLPKSPRPTSWISAADADTYSPALTSSHNRVYLTLSAPRSWIISNLTTTSSGGKRIGSF